MVNVPPLLSSTPPPIDFGEDDDDDSGLQTTLHMTDDGDEYSSNEFGLVTTNKHITSNSNNNNNNSQTDEAELNTKVVEVPPPDLALIENAKSTVEAFNYHVYHQEMSPPTPPPPSAMPQQQSDEAERVEEEEEEEEHVPSLKLDSLSLYSSESTVSGPVSPVAVAAAAQLTHQVTLEDVSDDDTDEECSPKKPKELYIREGAADFFAIEVLAKTTSENETKNLAEEAAGGGAESELNKPVAMEDDDSFADFEEATETMQPVVIQNVTPSAIVNDNDDDDFGDFADFSAAPIPALAAPVTNPVTSEPVHTQLEDGFDDFQEFASPADEGDDDFGDFSEPPPPPSVAAAAVVPPPPPPAPKHLGINERIKPVLEAMFPSTAAAINQTDKAVGSAQLLALRKPLDFGAIEQAQALNYQWVNSEMRHSLVRSLGIDSRNILFGDKWNSSMPRFAANLSFDPLKPLKSSSTTVAPTFVSPIEGLEPTSVTTAASTKASQIETRPGPINGEKPSTAATATGTGEDDSSQLQNEAASDSSCNAIDASAGTSAYAAPATAATLSSALSANGYAHDLNGSEQLHQQQQQHSKQFALSVGAMSSTPSPSPPQEDIEIIVSTSSYALPLKETHIYTPSKSDTAVAKTTTLAPIDFDFEIASAGIIIDETVVKKEYRDVEYKPPPIGLDSPNKVKLPSDQKEPQPDEGDNDDFSEFQSMPAPKAAPPRNGTPTLAQFGEQMILSPAILLPQAIPLAKTAIQWGENALSTINADEMARIEELFSAQAAKPPAPTISATVAKKPPPQQQPTEDDEWSDFVSAPEQKQKQKQLSPSRNNNNNVNRLKKPSPTPPALKDDDWSDFVSSSPIPNQAAPPPAPAHPVAVNPSPQFNSGAWQNANFYNNPLSLYQQQSHTHSNLVRNNNNIKSNSNYNANNNVPATPQQIHIMHDFSTAPSAQSSHPALPTYQQQHHRQQFQIGNAKVAPRISLIPDLSFVAPPSAMPTTNATGVFMSALPKSSFGAKK